MAQVRDLLGYLGMIVIPQQLAVPRAHDAFDVGGQLLDLTQRAKLDTVASALVRAAIRCAST
jgi:NAD(P)H-dependent FMN reductase